MRNRLPDLAKLASFLHDRRGNYAMMTAIVAMPLFAAVALSVDLGQSQNAQGRLQNAADAAALAAATHADTMSDDQLQALVNTFFESNGGSARFERLTEVGMRARTNFVEVHAESEVTNNFALFGMQKTLTVEATARAARTAVTPEIALVVDTTTSMGMGISWQQSAQVIGQMLADLRGQAPSSQFRVSLVPFNDRVNVGPDLGVNWLTAAAQAVLGGNDDDDDDDDDCPGNSFGQGNGNGVTCPGNSGQGNNNAGGGGNGGGNNQGQTFAGPSGQPWTGCMEPRERNQGGFRYALDDQGPQRTADRFEPTYPGFASGIAQNPANTTCPPPIVVGTQDVAQIENAMRGIGPGNGTGRFDVGLAWGWRALSPEWRGEWGVSNYPARSGETRKIVILFTDGHTTIHHHEYGAPGGDPYGWNNGHPLMFDHVADLCRRMKADNVEIMVFHALGNRAAIPTFRECASDGFYFSFENRDGMLVALRSVGKVSSVPRLVK